MSSARDPANEGRRWFEKAPPEPKARPRTTRAKNVEQLWSKCAGCSEVLMKDALAEALNVCPHCGYHEQIGAWERMAAIIDADSFTRFDEDLAPADPLEFVDSKPYAERIVATRKKTGENDAYIAGSAGICGIDVEIGTFNFAFMGGSMGSVVGEAITRQFERAVARKVPAIVINSSGGARMQEGVLSLMQMAKTCAALARLRDEVNVPYISVLTHPTTGGVAASFAMLGDIILAEPNALVGFAGPRVIEQTIGETLPEGFQTSEYLLDSGMVDRIVPRGELREMIARCLAMMVEGSAHKVARTAQAGGGPTT